MLQHLINNMTRPRPISYIGVSKLICAACAIVFHTWNELYPRNSYLIRGSHGKFYGSWAVPTGWGLDKQSALLKSIYSQLASHLSSSLYNYGLARRMSDSSAALGIESSGTGIEEKPRQLKKDYYETF